MGRTKSLTEKQMMFCISYIITGSTIDAYRNAYDCTRMSDATIRKEAGILKNIPKVKRAIDSLMGEKMGAFASTQLENRERAVMEIRQMAFANPKDIFTFDDSTGETVMKPYDELPPDIAKLCTVRPDGTYIYRPAAKLKALDMYCRILNLYPNDTNSFMNPKQTVGLTITISQ